MEESRILKGVTTSSYCFLCDKKLPNINKVQRHYNSPEHDKNLKWVKLNIFNYFEAPSPSSQESFYCFVCRSNFASEQLLKVHVKEFPHSILAKIKSNLVRDGITEEFAVPMKKKNMYCIICDAQLQHPFNASQHLISKAHKDLLCTWKKCLPAKKDISLDDNRWFHCRTCEVNLDGTTCAGKHHANHKSLVTPSHPSAELKVHFGTLSHIGPNTAVIHNNDTIQQKVADKVNEGKKLLSNKCTDNNPNSQLQESVFEQLEKLIETLYYSKKVPYEVSLQYLKRVNKEVEDLVQVHNESECLTSKSRTNNAFSKLSSCTSTDTSLSAVSSRDVVENDAKLYSKSSKTSITSTMVNNEVVITSPQIQKEVVSVVSQKSVTVAVPSKLAENSIPVQRTKSISDLLSEVVKRKSELTQHNIDAFKSENIIELQVLDEVEILVREVNKENAPLAEILQCLEKFNKDLDCKPFSKSEGREDYLSVQDEVNNDTKKSSNDKEFGLKLVYSRDELLKLRWGVTQDDLKFVTTEGNFLSGKRSVQGVVNDNSNRSALEHSGLKGAISKAEVVTTHDSLLSSLVFDCKQRIPRITYSRAELLRLRSCATHVCINAGLMFILTRMNIFNLTDECEIYMNTIYNYYSGTNFVLYMDFLNVYLHLSVDSCKKLNYDFATPASTTDEESVGQSDIAVKYFDCEQNMKSFYGYYTGRDFEEFMDFRLEYLDGSIENIVARKFVTRNVDVARNEKTEDARGSCCSSDPELNRTLSKK